LLFKGKNGWPARARNGTADQPAIYVYFTAPDVLFSWHIPMRFNRYLNMAGLRFVSPPVI